MLANPATVARPVVTKGPGRISRLLRAYCKGIAGYFVRRAAVASLRELDDRSLRDIGLVRSQIEAAVYGSNTRSDQPRS
jgi:uncharacterized protein YjiS (DUF1127 family)